MSDKKQGQNDQGSIVNALFIKNVKGNEEYCQRHKAQTRIKSPQGAYGSAKYLEGEDRPQGVTEDPMDEDGVLIRDFAMQIINGRSKAFTFVEGVHRAGSVSVPAHQKQHCERNSPQKEL